MQALTEQDATDEGLALLAFEPRLGRPGAIGERLVVEEVLRLLRVRQRLPLRGLPRLRRLRRRCPCVRPGLDIAAAQRFAADALPMCRRGTQLENRSDVRWRDVALMH